ncbi:MAG: hypothetical protein ABI863_09185 [Ginsengibacter sp.]
MKPELLFAIAITIIVLLSCNQGNKDKNASPDVVIEDTVFDRPPVNEDSALYVKNQTMLWHADDAKGFTLKKPEVPGIDTMSAKNLIQVLNANYDSIRLDYIKASHDTIYVHIPHSEMLTERIGSTGAEIYMASTTWSLTELKGIKYVNYDFEEGDHASPGVYSRNNFKNFQ